MLGSLLLLSWTLILLWASLLAGPDGNELEMRRHTVKRALDDPEDFQTTANSPFHAHIPVYAIVSVVRHCAGIVSASA